MRLSLFLIPTLAVTASAQDALKTLPNNYTLVFQNDQVRVIHVRYNPHEKLPVHAHPDKPTLYVYLTDSGPVRFSHIEEHAFAITRSPLKAGTFRLSPGRLEKHEVENLGDIPTEFLRVELRQIPIGFRRDGFRDRGPFDLTRTSISTAFPGPGVRIDRIIVANYEHAEIGNNADPALLIALAPCRAGPRALNIGEVLWLDAHRKLQVTGVSRKSAHLLQLLFLRGTAG